MKGTTKITENKFICWIPWDVLCASNLWSCQLLKNQIEITEIFLLIKVCVINICVEYILVVCSCLLVNN